MPKIKPQNMKSISYKSLQPCRVSERMRIIALMDISGTSNKAIAKAVGISEGRVSIIRNSPLYMEERDKERERLRDQVIDKQSTQVVNADPVEAKLKELAVTAVGKYEGLLESKNEGIKKSTADSILDRAGYKAFSEKTKVSVEVTEKMADRFERALKYNPRERSNGKAESNSNDRETKIRVEKKMP